MINNVTLIGRVGKVYNQPTNDKAPVKFSLATSERWKNKDTGEFEESTEWHMVVSFTSKEWLSKNLAVGMLVYVEGKIHYDKYTDNDGNEKKSTSIIAYKVKSLQRKNTSDDNNSNDVPF